MNKHPPPSETDAAQRKVILYSFPTGALLLALLGVYMWGRDLYIAGLVTFLISAAILVLCLILLVRGDLVRPVEIAFFYLFALFFYIVIIFNIDTAFKGDAGDFYIGSTLNGAGLWLAVSYISAYLALPKRQSSIFMMSSASGLVLVMLYHFIFHGGLRFILVLHWAGIFFALSVVIFLLYQTGAVQREYATRDMLTGVFNRREAYQILKREMDRAKRYRHSLTVMIFDVDHFKQVNDHLGHLIGDEILKAVISLVERSLRASDIFGRWGGDEFMVILPETDIEAACNLAERVRGIVEHETLAEGVKVSISLGVAEYDLTQSLESLMICADRALYQAKQNGRNQVVVSIVENFPAKV